MGCGCGQRRELAHKAMEAMRRGDRAGVKQNLTEMNLSVRADLRKVAAALPRPNFRLKPEVAKAYGLTPRN